MELLKPTSTSSSEEVELEDSGEASSILLAEDPEVVKKLLSSNAPDVDEILPEILEALNIVRLSWLTCLFNVTWRMRTVPRDW